MASRSPSRSAIVPNITRFGFCRLNRVLDRKRIDRDPAQLSKFVDASPSAEPSVSAILGAAEGHLRFIMNSRAVDVTHSRLHTTCDGQSSRYVLAEDRRGKAELRVIRDANRLLIACHASYGDYRSKRFFVINLHVWSHAVQDRRAHYGRFPRSSHNDTRSLRNRIL